MSCSRNRTLLTSMVLLSRARCRNRMWIHDGSAILQDPTMAYCASLTRHYQDFWSNRGHSFTWPTGPRWELPEDFTVLRFSPSPKRSAWTYATVCMSQEHDEARLELHLFSPVEAAEHVELLTAIAHYHRTGAMLGVGHTVNFGRPWLPGSLCTHGLISLPYLDGPELEVLKLNSIPV